MSGLLDHLRERIRSDGALDVAQYMEACLSHPQFGYYFHSEPFGLSGDFVTAPEISQMFGELLGLWAVHQWHAMGKPKKFLLVELGPGRGTLMADALRAAQGLPEFINAMDLRLVETSCRLRDSQKQLLKGFQPHWHNTIEELPEYPLIVIANEFFDALPIHQFVYSDSGWLERRIGVDARELCFTLSPPQLSIAAETAQLAPAKGDVFECSPLSRKIVSELAVRCQADSGCALIIDYGHGLGGLGDTLQAVRGHAYAPVLERPGASDLTAHVDFQALASAAQNAGALIYGATPQGAFLTALGIKQRTDALLVRATPEQRQLLLSGRDRLVNDDQMGTLFKVMAITGTELPEPSGFQNPCHFG